VPDDAREDFSAYLPQLPGLLKRARAAAGITAKRCDVAFPSCRQHWVTLRTPKIDPEQLSDAVGFEAADKLPFALGEASFRHEVVGEVHTKDGPRLEVIVGAGRRRDAQGVIDALERSGLEPASLPPAPKLFAAGFDAFFRRDSDANQVWLAVDLGRRQSRAFVIRRGGLAFARGIDFDLERAIRLAAGDRPVDAFLAERAAAPTDTAPCEPAPEPAGESFALLGAAMRRTDDKPADVLPGDPLQEAAETLAGEVVRCRRYYDAAFPNEPITRLAFFGGGGRDQRLCRAIAKRVGVAAQVGDFPAAAAPGHDRVIGPTWSLVLGAASLGRSTAMRRAA